MSELFKLESQTHTYIGENTSLSGEFHFQGYTLVGGELDGEVHIHNESPLVIESTGKVKGIIYCQNLKVYGQVEGQIKAKGKITFYPSSQFSGQVEAADLNILPGSKINMEARTDVQL
jgi:cytoskeletal protein CcmA (bactofilin family)